MTTSAGKPQIHPDDKGYLKVCGALLVLVSVPTCIAMWLAAPAARIESFNGPTMGTRYSVSVVLPSKDLDPKALQKSVDTCLAEINRQMSTYDPTSEISRFNEYEGNEWFAVSPETVKVVYYALQVANETDGAFDPTVGPAVNLWGFGPERRRNKSPSDVEIEAALSRIGYQRVEVRLDPPALRKEIPGIYLDLSALAKGYAVDAVTELLAEHGIESSMVEIGGEVRTQGRKPGNNPWRIGIEQPEEMGRVVREVLELENSAMATSGDYRNFFEQDGVRYSHTIDPATGRPTKHRLATVSVLADRCMEADALATALLVLGEDRGYDWCESHNVAALFLIREVEGQFEERVSPAFTLRNPRQEKVAQ